VLTNENQEHQNFLREIANESKLAPDLEKRFESIVEDRKQLIMSADDAARRRLSAELNGINATGARFRSSRTQHILVHTDTAPGLASACILKGVLDGADLLTTPGLRTASAAEFRDAVSNLAKTMLDYLAGYRRHQWLIVFNLTGGFKSINAYLQALGMIYADHCVFIFEGARELMEVPRLPIRMAEVDTLRDYVDAFRKLSVGYPVSSADVQGAPESLFNEIDGWVSTSVLGDVVWATNRREVLRGELHQPLSAKLIVSDGARGEFSKLAAERQVQVNEAIDELAAYFDWKRPLLKSREFKKLQAPVGKSTHELYLWSDGAAGRLFGHFEDSLFVADTISGHL
jgi:putative CRISPR-associated protein (TIGR02619 family)